MCVRFLLKHFKGKNLCLQCFDLVVILINVAENTIGIAGKSFLGAGTEKLQARSEIPLKEILNLFRNWSELGEGSELRIFHHPLYTKKNQNDRKRKSKSL